MCTRFVRRGNGLGLLIDIQSMRRQFVGLAATVVVAGGLGLAGMGLASGTAQAEPGLAPSYHWCPGDVFPPEWGLNFDWFTCHDDHHHDIDGFDQPWRAAQPLAP
jgi:hypothetical protein